MSESSEDRALWDKGSKIYEDFKSDLSKKYNMSTKTQTPTTYTLEEFATLKGKKLFKVLISEYLISIDVLKSFSGYKLK